MTAPIIKQMTTVNLEQGSQEWLDYRITKGGASEVSYLFGTNPFCSAQDQEKYLVGLKLGFNTIFSNTAMRAGNDNEADIIAEIERKHDIVTQPLIGYIDDVSASFDGITLDSDVIIEVKYSNHTYDYVLEHKDAPENYYLQVQQQLLVSGADKAIFGAMHTETREVITCSVDRDEDIISAINKKWESFFKLLKSKEWKEEDFNEDREDLDWLQAVDNYKDAKSMETEAKEAMSAAKKILIGLSDGIRTKGGGISVYPTKARETINYSQIVKDNHIEIEDKYKKTGTASWSVRVNK